MPEYLAPGVYVEELSVQPKPFEAVPTSTTGFIGLCHKGPIKRSTLVTSLAEFERRYGGGRRLRLAGGALGPNYTWHAVRAFSKEGGRRLYVVRVPRWTARDCQQALTRFEAVEEISIVAAPGSAGGHEDGGTGPAIAKLLIESAERMRYRFTVLDSGSAESIEGVRAMRAGLESARAVLGYPWVRVKDPTKAGDLSLPPSGFVAGIYARVDAARGVSKAPPSESVKLAVGLDHNLTEASLTGLNTESINCIRAFAPSDFRVWGTRTLGADSDRKYINVSHLVMYLEQSISKGTQWAVFESNAEPLWSRIRGTIENFLMNEWRSGSLQGSRAAEAFFVKCDRSTMTQDDLDQGRLVCLIGVAVVKPAEFVILRIGQWTADRPRSRLKRRRRSVRRGAR